MEQTSYTTMTTEEETPEVGPNDIVIHLVNPFKCGMCELEFLDKTVFKDHIFSHLEQIKHERPSSQIVMNIVLPPETPGGVTVTRDILQLGEDGSIKQVIQPANSITLNQVLPLKELEAAGVLKLDHTQPAATPVTPALPKAANQSLSFQTPVSRKPVVSAVSSDNAMDNATSVLDPANSTFIKEEAEDVSEIIENTDGTFSVAFKGPNNEMQHIQIIRPEGMKGDMMLELTNTHHRRSKGAKINECDICGKILSSSTNLLRHKMYHSSERPFVCQTCGKGFKDVSNLKKHTMIHNRIFPCHLCKKSFLRKSLLAMHLKRHQARTVFVKSGSGAKEVTLKTFVDDDGTRVEEMSMAALQGQTFEYKKRIMKADPSDIKPDIDMDKEIETSTASVSASNAQIGESMDMTEEGQNDENDRSVTKFMLTDEDLLDKAEQQSVSKDKKGGDAVDDLPDLDVPDVPKEFVKMYQCGHCGKRTVQRGNMMRHLIHHLRDKPFKCDECPKQFVDKGELVKHIKTHTKPYRCNRCDGAFAHNVQLMKHQETECLGDKDQLNYSILDDGQTYRCDICQIEMKRLGNMIKHVGTHTGNRSARKHWPVTPKARVPSKTSQITAPYAYNAITRKFQCNFCKEIFYEKRDVHQHIKNIHAKQQLHQCSDCDSWFHSSEALKKHATIHAKPFKCEHCDATFAHKILLESHTRKHNERERDEETADYGKCEDRINYYCKHCDKKLSKKFHMMNHIRKHLDQRPFECSDCNKCFSTQYMLSSHKKIHAKLFTCENCGEAFTRKLFLQIHRKKHEESIEEKDIENLDETPAANNKRKSSLDKDSPSEDGAFICKICLTPFNRLVIKLNHERKCKEESKVLMRLPTGDGFQCKICHRIATLKHNLMVHIRKNHSDIVKIDHSGQIQVPDEFMPDEESFLEESGDEETPQTKRQKLNVSSDTDNKKSIWDWETKDNEDKTDNDDQDDEEVDEINTDRRYTKTTGGFACNVCRRKYTDLNTLLLHYKSHENEEGAKQTELSQDDEKSNGNASSVERTYITTVRGDGKTSRTERPTRAKTAAAASKPAAKEVKIKVESTTTTPVRKDDNKNTDTPTVSPTRSSSRPARSQKIPSRFLE